MSTTLPSKLLTIRNQPEPTSSNRHTWSAVPVGGHWVSWAPLAVDMFEMASTLLVCVTCSRTVPSGTNRQLWSAVPLSANCTTLAESAVDMPATPSTLPEFLFLIRTYP